jgi:DNA-binding response OmpR family regulator
MALAVERIFTRDTVEIRLAHSLQDALNACFSFQPHVLMLDIGMPDGDGFNLVDWLRKHDSLARLPLAVYSGRGLSPEECGGLSMGPAQFLAKASIRPQQLEALVLTMLRIARTSEETTFPEASLQNP